MTDDDLDRLLANEAMLTPSDQFTVSVMAAVVREVTALPPIGFPWLRAIPGIGALLASVGMAAQGAVSVLREPEAAAFARSWMEAAITIAGRAEAPWVALATFMTIVSVTLTPTFVGITSAPPRGRTTIFQ